MAKVNRSDISQMTMRDLDLNENLDGMSDKNIKDVLDSFLRSITNSVSDGDRVTISGFGRFERKWFKGRKIRSVASNKSTKTKAGYHLAFKASPHISKKIDEHAKNKE